MLRLCAGGCSARLTGIDLKRWHFHETCGSTVLHRCLFNALLIAGYFAGQLAAFPHAHAREPVGHGGRPHFHANWFTRLIAKEGHSHHHHAHDRHSGHSHHHHSGHSHHHHSPEQDRSHEQPENAPATPDGRGHDADCVYLLDSLIGRAPASWPAPSQAAGDVHFLAVLLDDGPDLAAFRSVQTHAPPDVLAGGCPLFLKLRTLRI